MKLKNKIIVLMSFIFLSLSLFFIFKIRSNSINLNDAEISLSKDVYINNEQKNEAKNNEDRVQDNVKDEVNYNELSPHEYVAWLKDPKDRVLLEIKNDGARIFRKGNVTITVMPNGEELYLPDEL
ncbi:hypothetical protein [Fluviispira vulneris]|uniref:hypothetical protein n=1 Tax=Fluviispira vulneris TaxID=2763012 RepID=UPI0016461435|nr:hypothetical protein [Fluviispira vulneris]